MQQGVGCESKLFLFLSSSIAKDLLNVFLGGLCVALVGTVSVKVASAYDMTCLGKVHKALTIYLPQESGITSYINPWEKAQAWKLI